MSDNSDFPEFNDIERARNYNETARNIFAPLYPVLAEKIIKLTGITEGFCIDLGCGPAHLAMAMSEYGFGPIVAADKSGAAVHIAVENIAERGLRIGTLCCDAAAIAVKSETADLIVSRGSVFFWENRTDAFREIRRVLRPGGKAAVGGGFGSPEIKKKIIDEMDRKGDGFSGKVRDRLGRDSVDQIRKELESSVPGCYSIYQDEANFLIIIEK